MTPITIPILVADGEFELEFELEFDCSKDDPGFSSEGDLDMISEMLFAFNWIDCKRLNPSARIIKFNTINDTY